MSSYIEQFIKTEKDIDMNALSEEEMLIVDTAADKVREQLNLINLA